MSTIGVNAGGAFPANGANGVNDLTDRGGFLFASFTTWLRKRRGYYNTIAELSALSERELADIGIMRSDIPAIARQSVSR